ncbi:hypothetical protein AMELA_G00042940 [Ameiurus melas]|uniref:Transforming acidic coiled-coil-containing protein C-terminal domain-containing protein n=1 Tax=Ameiurus melas TaxID=219545 RepID=A0A7J6B4B2_AMEME|nr:hypothetical protein AMELA_G00042940 [Ameiurus melas]
MSSEVANDENQGARLVPKHVPSESSADIFALDQPTGRPSILRPSQAENLLKNIPKGVKVCFQTPLRDPVTKKIMSPSRVGTMAALDDCTNALESLMLTSPPAPSVPTKTGSSFPDDDLPIQSRGGYTIDFDNLDCVNPFQSSSVMIPSPSQPAAPPSDTPTPAEPTLPASSPAPGEAESVKETADLALDETLPFIPSVENSLSDLSADGASTDTTVIIEPKRTTLADNTVDVEVPEPEPAAEVNEDVKESLSLPKGAYQVDFDNLDSVNPFHTGSSKPQNSPPGSGNSPVCDSAPSRAEETGSGATALPSEGEPLTTERPGLDEVNPDPAAASVAPPKAAPMLLEFHFDDGAKVERKPPPKRLGLKKPPLSRTKTAAPKPVSAPAEKKRPEIEPESCDAATEIPPARGAYSIDFDQFDDPNFNPFGATPKMGSSPPRDAPVASQVSEQPEKRTHGSPSSDDEKSAEADPSFTEAAEEPEASPVAETLQPCAPVLPEKTEEPAFPCALSQSAEFDLIAADEEFVPGSMFMPSDLDGQIDYLEQFGSSTFKDSALRKQSLYLKFDPLLKESPKKAAADSSRSGFSLPRPSLAIRMMEAARSEVRRKSQQESSKLLADFTSPVRDAKPAVVQDPTVLDLLVPTLKQTQESEDMIVDMLKYTQKDLDTALEKARKQAQTEIEKLTLDNQHMVLIVSEFEALIAQLTAEHKQKDELAQAELSRVLQEKQQLAKELSDMERSFSDVVKRLDRRKEVIDGFKKNEETLKQCAQSYLARLQKDEQRYQTLKTHAEEKIDQANKQIAEVRTKLGSEVSALQVQLRREQLKVQSLEKNLEQKTKEVEDVTKLCDELIVKVQQH